MTTPAAWIAGQPTEPGTYWLLIDGQECLVRVTPTIGRDGPPLWYLGLRKDGREAFGPVSPCRGWPLPSHYCPIDGPPPPITDKISQLR